MNTNAKFAIGRCTLVQKSFKSSNQSLQTSGLKTMGKSGFWLLVPDIILWAGLLCGRGSACSRWIFSVLRWSMTKIKYVFDNSFLIPIWWYRWLGTIFINGGSAWQRRKLSLKSVTNTFFGGETSYIYELLYRQTVVRGGSNHYSLQSHCLHDLRSDNDIYIYIYHGRILGRAEIAPIAGIGSSPPS